MIFGSSSLPLRSLIRQGRIIVQKEYSVPIFSLNDQKVKGSLIVFVENKGLENSGGNKENQKCGENKKVVCSDQSVIIPEKEKSKLRQNSIRDINQITQLRIQERINRYKKNKNTEIVDEEKEEINNETMIAKGLGNNNQIK